MSEQLRLDDERLGAWLEARGIVPTGTQLAVESAGDGNINWVRRARAADGRSWVVKQARPALEGFPEYEAPTERIVFEQRYFELASKLPEGGVCPRILDFDEADRVLVMEDLSGAERLDAALARGADATAAASTLGRFLGAVHGETRDPGLAARFDNRAMQRLHGDHIFEIPLRENDFPLADEVRAEADRLRGDAALVAIADGLYQRYLEPRGALVHGDVQAGNVLLAATGPKLLDAEIAHVGDPAFDLGVLVAHLLIPAAARGAAGDAAGPVRAAFTAWESRLAGRLPTDFADVARYAGIELLRRTIGAARVAAVERPRAALAVLAHARAWLRDPPSAP